MPTHLLLKGSVFSPEDGSAQTIEAELSRVKSSGAVVVEVNESLLSPELVERLMSARFGLIIRSTASKPADFNKAVALAQQTKARAINFSPAFSENKVDALASMVQTMIQQAADAKVAVHFVTSDWLTFDLANTVQFLKSFSAMRLTLDVFSFVPDPKQAPESGDLLNSIDPLLDHVDMIHGHLPTALSGTPTPLEPQNIQASHYRDIWAEAMRRWRRRNPAGSTLVFVLDDLAESANLSWKIAQEAWKASVR